MGKTVFHSTALCLLHVFLNQGIFFFRQVNVSSTHLAFGFFSSSKFPPAYGDRGTPCCSHRVETGASPFFCVPGILLHLGWSFSHHLLTQICVLWSGYCQPHVSNPSPHSVSLNSPILSDYHCRPPSCYLSHWHF